MDAVIDLGLPGGAIGLGGLYDTSSFPPPVAASFNDAVA